MHDRYISTLNCIESKRLNCNKTLLVYDNSFLLTQNYIYLRNS